MLNKVFVGVGGRITLAFLMLAFLFSINVAEAEEETLFNVESVTVDKDNEFVSSVVEALEFSDLNLKFNYDTTKLDSSPNQDSFSYGYIIGEDRNQLGKILGLSGSSTKEYGMVAVGLPSEALVADLRLYIAVDANSSGSSDYVEVSDLSLIGTKEESEVDICPNLEGVQIDLPEGYELNESNECVPIEEEEVDICLNLEGIQTEVPEGYEIVTEGQCDPIEEEIIDVCPNIDGVQETVPEDYELDTNGDCVPQEEEPSNCPLDYARWVDPVNGGSIWQADDVYRSVVLIGNTSQNRRNFSIQRHVYVPGPTEVGDRYKNRFGNISEVCVR